MLSGSCHCGAVQLRLPGPPAYGNRCGCSICRRYGVVWGYFAPADVGITGAPDAIVFYCRDPNGLHFHRCRDCGCVTHWALAIDNGENRIGVNINLFDAADLACVPIRETEGPP